MRPGSENERVEGSMATDMTARQVFPGAGMGPRALETIFWGGAAVAILDITNAMTFWALFRGTEPHVILQSIAAGLLGKDAFSGGTPTAILGALLHVFIACGVAAVYYLACVRWPTLTGRPLTFGAIYGAVVYLVMNHVVLPLSLASPGPFIPAWFLDNLIGHIVLVGPPVAIIARWSASRARR